MKVSKLMTRHPRWVAPDDSIRRAAELMDEIDVGALPVCEDDRLVGIVTDRDITVRATALGSPPDSTNVLEVMTEPVLTISSDDDISDAEEIMARARIRRVPVLDGDGHLVGMISLADLALHKLDQAAAALEKISKPDETTA